MTESVPYARYAYRLPPMEAAEPGDLLRCKTRLFLVVSAFEQDGLLVVEADELRRNARARVQYGADTVYDPISDASSAQSVQADGLHMARALRYAVANISADPAAAGDQTWYFLPAQIADCKAGDAFTAEGARWRVVSASRQSGVWVAHCRPV